MKLPFKVQDQITGQTIQDIFVNSLVFPKILGRVVRITKDYVLEKRRRYTCSRCNGYADGESKYEHYFTAVIPKCPNWQKECGGYMRLATKDPAPGDLMKYQEIMLQEIDSPVSIPRIFMGTLEEDLVDSCAPGESVEINGTVEMRSNSNPNSKSNINIVIRCKSVRNLDGTRSSEEIEELKRQAVTKWQELVKDRGQSVARDLLLRNSFPSIKGMDYAKLSLLLLMTGSAQGIKTHLENPIRCQSHMLLVGDPATAKSKLLQGVANYVSPSLYTNAFGCSSAGLTAAAIRTGSHWTLQAGVLVLCDTGICCIDEWNLLKTNDQNSCHEAMEQQTVSIAKAGIATRMSTRCSIVAATNPKKHPGANEITTQVIGISTSLISRFDLIIELRDEKDDEWDLELIDFLLDLRPNDSPDKDLFTELDIKAHLMVARGLQPEIDQATYHVITAYYSFCRADEYRDYSRTTVRLQESLLRLACAHARLCFREKVTVVDAVTAIVLLESSVGFGRLIRPLSMSRELPLPLEPSRERIVQVLKMLKVSEDFIGDLDYWYERENREEVEVPKKKRKLNEQVKETPIAVVNNEKRKNNALKSIFNRVRSQKGESNDKEKEIVVEKEKEPTPVIETMDENDTNCSLNELILQMQAEETVIESPVVNESLKEMIITQKEKQPPSILNNTTEFLDFDQCSRELSLLQMKQKEVLSTQRNRGKGEINHTSDDEEHEDHAALSQISFHSFMNRINTRPNSVLQYMQKDRLILPPPSPLVNEAETLQVRLNDFDQTQKTRKEGNDNSQNLRSSPDLFEAGVNQPTVENIDNHFPDDDPMDDHLLSQIIIPDDTQTQNPKSNQSVIEETKEDDENFTFADLMKTIDFSVLDNVPSLFDRAGNFVRWIKFADDKEVVEGVEVDSDE